MTEDEKIIVKALWDLVKSYKSQYAMCKALDIRGKGNFNRMLSGKIPPSDKFCRLVGYRKVIKYEKLE